MDNDRWLWALGQEMARHQLTPDAVRHVVAEAAAHLRDSGQPALRAFGTPEGYAAAVAESLAARYGRPARPAPGRVRLSARGITKRYRRRTILRSVDLTVRAGEVAAVVGANGAGKSTFLRICAGLLAPDAGEVTLDGRLGYCPQDAGTYDFLLPDEQFVLIGAGRGLDRERSKQIGRAGAAALQWRPAAGVQTRHLSGGTRQKLNLVMASMGEPDVLLLDEPYQGFDRGTYLDFWQHVWRWRDEGRAVVVVTHLLSQLDQVDQVLDLTPATEGAAA
ncbi:ATP-binding cassette domain-containing protein [Micromonospora sp. CPCC 206061]|uniref:ATP-binding cassette domain-containing protein n=1 Tax=Micromonospora sp. CPCC 206061 TaxID=3122410 RepID=UPI002FF03673